MTGRSWSGVRSMVRAACWEEKVRIRIGPEAAWAGAGQAVRYLQTVEESTVQETPGGGRVQRPETCQSSRERDDSGKASGSVPSSPSSTTGGGALKLGAGRIRGGGS